MAQRNAIGSITKAKSGAWVCRVTVGYKDGKRVQKSKTVRGTKKKAQSELNKLLAQYGNIEPTAVNMTIAEFIDDVYLPWHDLEYPRRDSMNKLHETLGSVKKDVGGIELAKFTRHKAEMYATSAKYWKVNKLKAVLNKAVQWDYIAKNPFDGVKVDVPPPTRERFSYDALRLIRKVFTGNAIEPVVLLMSSCGIREGEALAVDWEDIDFETGWLAINNTWHYDNGEGWIEETKNDNSADWVKIPKTELARLEGIGRGKTGPICPSPTNKNERMKPNTLRERWRRKLKPLLGDEFLPPEKLRNTHGSILFDKGMSKSDIGNRLRNTERIAERYYIDDSKELQEKAAKVWDAAMQDGEIHSEMPDNVIYIHRAG